MNGANMIRIISSLALALVLSLTSQSMAVAKGASAATGKMVLCTGAGIVAVYFDAEGKPTSAPHICPDCVPQVVFEGNVAPLIVPMRIVVGTLVINADMPKRTTGTAYGPPTRGPPVSV